MSYSLPEAKVIADSISGNHRLITVEAKIHRIVLSEVNTHRAFSRNSASSRAVPMAKLRKMVQDDPAMPLFWGKNQAGMSAREELPDDEIISAIGEWIRARDEAIHRHENLERIGVHKQIANRILEPWLWHRVIISATEWDNFFWQRCHPDAQPEMGMGHPVHKERMGAAECIYQAIQSSQPVMRPLETQREQYAHLNWHLPYVTDQERMTMHLNELRAISVVRCARVSYLNNGQIRDPREDIARFDDMRSQKPPHWSPFEHVARPAKTSYESRGNFRGWAQLRGMFEERPQPIYER